LPSGSSTGLSKKSGRKVLRNIQKADLERYFIADDQRYAEDFSLEDIQKVKKKLGINCQEDELNCTACGYDTCHEHAIAILKGIAETEMCLPYTIDKLHEYIKELDVSNSKLASTQAALKQSEKLASMGQLAAGIAHEVNNPLGSGNHVRSFIAR
jgi:C4-dicarboxylate-specific signal transduction histidine kinase